MWLAYMIGEWTEGTVVTPMKVVQARLPESLRPAYETQKLEETCHSRRLCTSSSAT